MPVVTLMHRIGSLAPSLLVLPLAFQTPAETQDARSPRARLLHAPEPGSGQTYEVRTSYRNEARETDQWTDGTKLPGRADLTGVAIEKTLRLHDHFPAGEVLLRRKILGLEHHIAITVRGGTSERVSRARGQSSYTGRQFELNRVVGGATTWRLLARPNPVDESRHGVLTPEFVNDPPDAVLAAFPSAPLLAGLLPAHPVTIGDSWEVTPASAVAALQPVGELPVTFVHETGAAPPFGYEWYVSSAVAMRGDAAGECGAELVRFEDRDGRELAVIGLELSVEVVADLLSHFEPCGAQILRAGSEWGFEGRGELIWDLGASRAVELTLSGEVLQLWDFRWTEKLESRQLASGHLAIHVRETEQ